MSWFLLVCKRGTIAVEAIYFRSDGFWPFFMGQNYNKKATLKSNRAKILEKLNIIRDGGGKRLLFVVCGLSYGLPVEFFLCCDDIKKLAGRNHREETGMVVHLQLFHLQFELVHLCHGVLAALLIGGFDLFQFAHLVEEGAHFFFHLLVEGEQGSRFRRCETSLDRDILLHLGLELGRVEMFFALSGGRKCEHQQQEGYNRFFHRFCIIDSLSIILLVSRLCRSGVRYSAER